MGMLTKSGQKRAKTAFNNSEKKLQAKETMSDDEYYYFYETWWFWCIIVAFTILLPLCCLCFLFEMANADVRQKRREEGRPLILTVFVRRGSQTKVQGEEPEKNKTKNNNSDDYDKMAEIEEGEPLVESES